MTQSVQTLNLQTDMLTPIVRKATQNDRIALTDYQITPINAGATSGADVFRIHGTGHFQNERIDWSLILKILKSSAPTDQLSITKAIDGQTDIDYWKRETCLFESDLFQTLPDGVAAPHCYEIEQLPSEDRIWMEDIAEDMAGAWPLAQYGHAARHLGRLNGHYLAKRPLPDWPWLAVKGMRQMLERSRWPKFWQDYHELSAQHAVIRDNFPHAVAQQINAIWEERERFLQTLEALPQTVQHGDTGRKNTFARKQRNGQWETVLIDWGWAGIGAVGEDLAPVVPGPVIWFKGVPPGQLFELDQLAFDNYIQGLRDVGWDEDPKLARLGYTITVALRFGPRLVVPEQVALHEARRSYVESVMGQPIERFIAIMGPFREYVIACADEARELMSK
ncbi:MAG: phosphotransferase [Caldilineaceae bacterium]|nr:phosphotransferase [Caldilineaceae bacterium]